MAGEIEQRYSWKQVLIGTVYNRENSGGLHIWWHIKTVTDLLIKTHMIDICLPNSIHNNLNETLDYKGVSFAPLHIHKYTWVVPLGDRRKIFRACDFYNVHVLSLVKVCLFFILLEENKEPFREAEVPWVRDLLHYFCFKLRCPWAFVWEFGLWHEYAGG